MSIYKSYEFTVQPGRVLEINRRALFITCLAANAPFKLSIDSNPQSDFERGLTYTAEVEFNQVKIENTSGAVLELQLGFGVGGVQDNRIVNGEDQFSVQVTNEPTVNVGNQPTVNVGNQPTVNVGNVPSIEQINQPVIVRNSTIWQRVQPANTWQAQLADNGPQAKADVHRWQNGFWYQVAGSAGRKAIEIHQIETTGRDLQELYFFVDQGGFVGATADYVTDVANTPAPSTVTAEGAIFVTNGSQTYPMVVEKKGPSVIIPTDQDVWIYRQSTTRQVWLKMKEEIYV